MERIKAFVSPDNRISLHCPKCGLVKQVSVEKFKESKHIIKVRCTCRNLLTLELDFRRKYRKKTDLHGEYAVWAPSDGERKVKGGGPRFQKCLVDNLSLGGLGLTVSGHGLKVGDALRVRFTLDDRQKTELDRKVVVRVVMPNYIGAEFVDSAYFQYDRAIGFYLMP